MSESRSAAYLAAMRALARVQPAPTDLIQFTSRGRALVLAPPKHAAATAAMDTIAPALQATLCHDEVEISGHLGAFKARAADGTAHDADLIIDYHTPPQIQRNQPRMRTLPLGYTAIGAVSDSGDDAAVAELLSGAKDMVGNFTKPRYFSYQPDICAHSASSISGCDRCLQACSTQAIQPAGDKIAVNPHLCQGCGGCVMTCPTGALRYAYPRPQDMLDGLRAAIDAYRRESDHAPVVLFYAADRAAEVREAPPHALPVALEEVGAAGLEIWFAALAYGAAHVAVYADNGTIAETARGQLEVADAILSALQLPVAVSLLTAPAEVAQLPPPAQPIAAVAQFAADDDKRRVFFLALNHFVEYCGDAAPADELIPLPAGAPFGEIAVDAARCTLCMACAGACPASAVRAGNTAPRLTFVEENCVQCGLCEATCPESAITLTPRINTDKNERWHARLLNEDSPLHCTRCNKAFASKRMVSVLEEKLKGHWMFKQPDELRRLRLCEECRVIDMFDGGGAPKK